MKSAIGSIPGKISELMAAHLADLAEAWANAGDEGLTISFSAKIGFDKNNKGTCEVSIAFTKDKVKDSTKFSWDDKQLSLLKKEAV